MVGRAFALVPVSVALIGLLFPPTGLVFVGWPVGQDRLFLTGTTCAAREATRSAHDAIVAIVLGWDCGARHLRGSAEGR